jgi:hypothetical protein
MKLRIKTISKGPLVKGIKITNITYIRKKYFDGVGKVGVRFIRDEINKRKWKSPGAASRVKKSIFSYVPPNANYLSFGTNKPYLKFHEEGVKKQPMKWLVGLNKPLGPLIFKGKKTFRWAPKNSAVFAAGKWIHPGLKPKRFFEKGIEKTREFVDSKKSKEKFVSDILKGNK